MQVVKVLHLIDSAGIYGAERVILTLLEELKNTLYPGILGCIREKENEIPGIALEADRIGIPVMYFTMKRGLNPMGIRQITNFIKDNGLYLVHSHGYKPNIYLGLLWSRKFKTVSTIHGWAKQSNTIKGKTYEYLDARALRMFDSVVAVSKAVTNDLKIRGINSDGIKLIYNGLKIRSDVPIDNIPNIRNEYGIDEPSFVIGSVGRLAKVKGQVYLIEAMQSILKDVENCRLLIAGEGPERGYLEYLIEKYNLREKVKLLGYVRNIEQFLAVIDLFVLPSLSEGLPMSLLEAMAAGKPVLASAVGGITEVIENGDSGVLVPPADPSSLAESVKELYRSSERMSGMAHRGKSVVETKYSSGGMAEKYLAVYSQLLA